MKKTIVLFGILLMSSLMMNGCSQKVSKEYLDLLEKSQTLIDENSNYIEAEELIDQAIEMYPEAPEAYVQAGYIHLIRGEYNQANDMLSKSIEYEENFQDEDSKYFAYLNMGNLKYQQHQSASGLEYLLKAVEINDEDPAVHNALGLVYVDLEKWEEAIEAYDKSLEIDAGYFYTYANVASLYHKRGDYERAINEISTALALNDQIPHFFIIKGDIEMSMDQLDTSIETFSEAIMRWSSYPDAYYKRGEAYLLQGKYLKAINDFAYARDSGITEAILGMGYSYQGLEQYEDAIEAFALYLESIERVDLRAMYEIGVSYYQLEDYTQSITAFDELLEFEPEDTEALLIKAYALEKSDDYETAYKILQEIIAINSEHQAAKEEIAFIEENNLLND